MMKPVLTRILISIFIILLFGCPNPSASDPGLPRVAAPIFSVDPAGGPFDSAFSVELSSATPGASIYYVDSFMSTGDPGESTNLYSFPLPVYETRQYKAIAFKSGMTPSKITTGNFVVNPVSLPFSDDFEDGNTVGWTSNGASVDPTTGADGSSNSVKLVGDMSFLDNYLLGISPSSVRFFVQAGSASSSGGYIGLGNNSLVYVGFDNDGTFDTFPDITNTYSENTWYKIEMVFSYAPTGTYDMYVNDVLVIDDADLIDKSFTILTATGSSSMDFWIDEILIQ